MKPDQAPQIDANLIAGKNLGQTPDIQSKSVGSSPRSRKRKLSEVQGLKKVMKTTLSKMDNGLRIS
jgi:hypothetical protein